jgi:hypothetical protein
MAIRIPILTSFDPKGLKQANAQFAKLSGSVSSLGRNFAVAGVALTAITAGLARTVQTASSYAESINAVNVAFGKSAQGIIDFGKTAATTLGVSQVDFNNAAVRFSAFAERIVGSGGDASKFIAQISTRASDFASVFNIEVSEALQVFQSGLAGEAEPLKRFGINLLDSEVKAYAMANGIGEVGRQLTETEKVQARYGLLMQATGKTSGDFANTSNGLANQLRILKAEVSNTEIEIGNQLLPVMAELLPIVRDLVRDLGTQLVAAVKAVDWKALTTDLMNTLSFFIKNATAIAQLTVAVFAINTAFKAMQVAIGIVNVALALKTWYVAQLATGMNLATIAAGKLKVALSLIGVVAAVAAVVAEYVRLKTAIDNSKTSLSKFNTESLAVSGAVAKLNPINTLWQKITLSILAAITAQKQFKGLPAIAPGRTSVLDDFAFNTGTGVPVPGGGGAGGSIAPILTGGGGSAGGTAAGNTGLSAWIATSKKEARVAALQAQLIAKGLSSEVAASLTASSTPIRTANEALNRINKNGEKAVSNLTNRYNQSAAGQQAAAAAAAAAAQAAADAAASAASDQANAVAAAAQAAAQAAAEMAAAQEAANRAAQEAAAREAAILAERQRVFQSFQDSVRNTFAGIRDSILGAFDLRQLGGSTNAIARNMEKLLNRLRSFTLNVRNLAGMGLDPALLQQVISAGPIGGARLAASLVAGGASGLSAINAGFSEFGFLSSQIAATGTGALFGQSSQQNIYNINVDGGVGSGSTIGKAIVDAIKAYERTSGAVWQGA